MGQLVMDDAQQKQRKLRLAESAAGSAVAHGCDPDEVRRQMEIGIAQAVWMNNRKPGERPPWLPEAPVTRTADPAATTALDAWARAVEG